jgi:SSS family solute:Na+ symporter
MLDANNFAFHFGAIDYILVAIYLVFIFYLGFKYSDRKSEFRTEEEQKENYLLAGRKLTLPVFVATLVATWYGNIFGVGEFVYNDGIVGWLCFSFTYYISAFLFAIFIAGKIKDIGAATIPEQIKKFYGEKASFLSSIIVLVITLPAVYALILGIIVQMFTGWSLEISVTASTIFCFAYIYKGGFKADAITNTAQFILMYLGFAIFLGACILKFGSPIEMLGKLPPSHLNIFGSYNWQFILAWFIIAFQTFIDPGFHQRCAAISNPKNARKGVLISILCWIVFDFMTLTTGLYAKAYLPAHSQGILSYPLLSELTLSVFWKGIFVVSILATVMSTLDSYALISGATIGNDILKEKFKLKASSAKLTAFGLMIAAALSIILAIAIPSAVDLIYKTSSIAVPGLIYPLAITYSRKRYLSSKSVLIIMSIASGISLIWTLCRSYNITLAIGGFEIFGGIEPMLPGILLSLIIGILLTKTRSKNVDNF